MKAFLDENFEVNSLPLKGARNKKMSLMRVHIGAQIHATVPVKFSNTLQGIYLEIDSETNFLGFEAAN